MFARGYLKLLRNTTSLRLTNLNNAKFADAQAGKDVSTKVEK